MPAKSARSCSENPCLCCLLAVSVVLGCCLLSFPAGGRDTGSELHDLVVLQLQSGDSHGQVRRGIGCAENEGRFHGDVLVGRRRRQGLGRLAQAVSAWIRRRRWRRGRFRNLYRRRNRTPAILLRVHRLAEMPALEQHGFIGLHLIRCVAHALGNDNGGRRSTAATARTCRLAGYMDRDMHRSRARHEQPQVRRQQRVRGSADQIVHLQVAAVQAEQQLAPVLRGGDGKLGSGQTSTLPPRSSFRVAAGAPAWMDEPLTTLVPEPAKSPSLSRWRRWHRSSPRVCCAAILPRIARTSNAGRK